MSFPTSSPATKLLE